MDGTAGPIRCIPVVAISTQDGFLQTYVPVAYYEKVFAQLKESVQKRYQGILNPDFLLSPNDLTCHILQL